MSCIHSDTNVASDFSTLRLQQYELVAMMIITDVEVELPV
jgi:hypothetical protein